MSGSEFNWAEFLNMGGYALYVWPSYGLALVLVIANVVSPIMQRRKIITQIRRAIKRQAIHE